MPFLPSGCTYRVRNATHICIELADLQHVCDIYIYTHTVHLSVMRDATCEHIKHLDIVLDKRRCHSWEDIVEAYQEKAIKHFARPIRHKSVTDERIRRGR